MCGARMFGRMAPTRGAILWEGKFVQIVAEIFRLNFFINVKNRLKFLFTKCIRSVFKEFLFHLTNFSFRREPWRVERLSEIGVVKVDAGDQHSIALTVTGEVFCFSYFKLNYRVLTCFMRISLLLTQ